MEEDQELKHVCKFCSKSFPCGRSLGGHMRSHVTNVSSETEKFATTKKLSSLNNNDNNHGGGDTGNGSEAGTNAGYGLRENPKKTWRLTDTTREDTLMVLDKFCKECGKGFQSWKALFGHMKCHSEKERVSNNDSLDDQDSCTNNNVNQKLVMDSQSDTETTAPNRRRRSKRRRTRYMTPVVTSSMSFATNPWSCGSEVEQEQEEVAMSLMMLSRDMSPWGGFNSVAEYSDNNSLHLEAQSSVPTNLVSKIESKRLISNGSEMKKVAKLKDKKLEFGNSVSSNLNSKGKSSELLATESPGNGLRMNKTRVSIKVEKPELDSESAFEVNGTELVFSKSAATTIKNNKFTSIKAKFLDSEPKSTSSLKNWVNKASEGEFSKNSNKRGKFECTTCNKIFHSYQALGGHRASHKKIKGCFASRNESSENSIELEAADLSLDPTTTESNLNKNTENIECLEEHELGTTVFHEDDTESTKESKKKGHECPICLKIFPSGQALGGHKRSHLASESESSRQCHSQTVVLQEAVPEIRDFLDLNLPAATEEESNRNAEPYRPWWVVESNHKQETLVGLMSN